MSSLNFDKFVSETRKILVKDAKSNKKYFNKEAVIGFDSMINESKAILKKSDLLKEWSVPFKFKSLNDLVLFEKNLDVLIEELFKETKTKKVLSEAVSEPIAEEPYAIYEDIRIMKELGKDNPKLMKEYLSWTTYTTAPPLIKEELQPINEVIDLPAAMGIARFLASKLVPARSGGYYVPDNVLRQVATQNNLTIDQVADIAHAGRELGVGSGLNVQSAHGTQASGETWLSRLLSSGQNTSNVSSGGGGGELYTPGPNVSGGGGGSIGIGGGGSSGIGGGGGGGSGGIGSGGIGSKGGGATDSTDVLLKLQKQGGGLWAKVKALWANLSSKVGIAAKALWATFKELLAKGVAWIVAHPYLVGAAILAAIIGASAAVVLKRRGERIKKLQDIARYLKRRPHLFRGLRRTGRDIESGSERERARVAGGQKAKETIENPEGGITERSIPGLGALAQRGLEWTKGQARQGLDWTSRQARQGLDWTSRQAQDAVINRLPEPAQTLARNAPPPPAAPPEATGTDTGTPPPPPPQDPTPEQAEAQAALRNRANELSSSAAAARGAAANPEDEGVLTDEQLWDEMTKKNGDMAKTNPTIRSQMLAYNTVQEWYYGLTSDEKAGVDAYTVDKTKTRQSFGTELEQIRKEFFAMFGDYREARRALNKMVNTIKAAGSEIKAGAIGSIGITDLARMGTGGGALATAGKAVWGGTKAAIKAIPSVIGSGVKAAYHGVKAGGAHGFGGVQRGIGAVSNLGASQTSAIRESDIPSEKQMLKELFSETKVSQKLVTEEEIFEGLYNIKQLQAT